MKLFNFLLELLQSKTSAYRLGNGLFWTSSFLLWWVTVFAPAWDIMRRSLENTHLIWAKWRVRFFRNLLFLRQPSRSSSRAISSARQVWKIISLMHNCTTLTSENKFWCKLCTLILLPCRNLWRVFISCFVKGASHLEVRLCCRSSAFIMNLILKVGSSSRSKEKRGFNTLKDQHFKIWKLWKI